MAGVGTNRYAYSFNDPVNKIDPNGNEATDQQVNPDGDDNGDNDDEANVSTSEKTDTESPLEEDRKETAKVGSGRVTDREGNRTNISPDQQDMCCAVAGAVSAGATSRAVGPEIGSSIGASLGLSCAQVDNDTFNDVATGFFGAIGGPIADGFGMGLMGP